MRLMRSCFIGIICLFCYCFSTKATEILDREIRLPNTKETTYELLNRISDLTGFFFIYDSDIVNNEKKVKFPGGAHSVKQSIYLITQNPNIQIKVIDRHILLYKKEISTSVSEKTIPVIKKDTSNFIVAKAIIRDAHTKEPVPFVSASLENSGIGTVSNQSGEFMLKIPQSDTIRNIQISHIGYNQQIIPVGLFLNSTIDIYLQTKMVPLQEVIVGLVNPQKIVREMINARPVNCQTEPVHFTGFYREGVERKNSIVSLTEAVVQIHKTGFDSPAEDQVKLLKMRKISSSDEKDSIILKMRAGIDASLHLDIMKHLPDFLDFNDENPFNYTKIDMTVTDSGLAHVIEFEQKTGIQEPLYKGKLYIDANNSALLVAHFEINPQYIDKAAGTLVLKKPRGVDIKPENASYYVHYKYWNGKYYLNHLRGDLTFKVKKKNAFLQSTKSIHTFFEMVVCKIDTTDVKRFPRKESIMTHKIFSETTFQYDKHFWDDFNIILPEERLNEAINQISSKIEEIE